MEALNAWLNTSITIACVGGLGFLRWLFRNGSCPDLWGIRWLLTWWLVAYMQLLFWDVSVELGMISPTFYSLWRRIAARLLVLIGIAGCCQWALWARERGKNVIRK